MPKKKDERITIKVHPSTRKELEKLKRLPEETLDTVIRELIKSKKSISF